MFELVNNRLNKKTDAFSCRRRQILLGLAAAGLAPGLSAENKKSDLLTVGQKREVWVSAQGSSAKFFGVSWTDSQSGSVETALSGFRGHAVSAHPLRPENIIMYGRRPAVTAVEVSLKTGEVEKIFSCADGKHLLGHGCFSKKGHLLYTTEAELKSGRGKIVVRDALSYRQLDELESYGIGPHEIKLMPDGKTLVIANGGILTHPDTGRKKLNLETMQSSLLYIDLKSGRKLNEITIPEPKASIRHLDVASDGTVVFAMQVQREACGHNKVVPLVGSHKQGEKVKLFVQPERVTEQMKDYAGSVVINEKHRVVGVTSPKGDLAAFWHIDSGELAGYHQLSDVCGINLTADQSHFVMSSSIGQLRFIEASTLKENKSRRIVSDNIHWDNHLVLTSL